MKLAEQSSESLGNSIRSDHTVTNQIMGNEVNGDTKKQVTGSGKA